MISKEQKLITLGVIFGLFLSAIELTSVGPAVPKIMQEIGGLDSYSHIFTSYLIASTLFIPVWGRLADHQGRKKLFLTAMGLFLLGCFFCGISQNISQLIWARAFKGIGAAGIVPIGLTILADIFELEQRTKIQGFLSAAWGISSLIGPFLGGSLTDSFGWRWVFFINIVPGILAMLFIHYNFSEKKKTPSTLGLSFWSFASSTFLVCCLLLSLESLKKMNFLWATLLALGFVLGLFWFSHAERKAKHPLVPKILLTKRLFVIGCLTGFFTSGLVIGLASFGPLLFQNIFDYSATESGLLLMPFSLSWVFASIFSARMMLKYNYKKLLHFGFALAFLGCCLLLVFFFKLNTFIIVACMIIMGVGMAYNYPIVLIAIQHHVGKNHVGFATSSLSWVRNLGATLGTSFMGLALIFIFKQKILAIPNQATAKSFISHLQTYPDLLFKPETFAQIKQIPELAQVFHQTLFWVFGIFIIQTFCALLLSFFFPAASELKNSR